VESSFFLYYFRVKLSSLPARSTAIYVCAYVCVCVCVEIGNGQRLNDDICRLLACYDNDNMYITFKMLQKCDLIFPFGRYRGRKGTVLVVAFFRGREKNWPTVCLHCMIFKRDRITSIHIKYILMLANFFDLSLSKV